MASPTFLGLDLSTQQIKAVLIDEESNVVHESAVAFDKDLPQYGTTNGAIKGPEPGEVTSPVAMWLDAIELLMERMTKAGVDFAAIAAISGAGQQHGSVYWSANAGDVLASLDSTKALTQLSPGAFSLPNAPIWQDSSTTRECREIEEAFGGAQALADISGSRAYERFTGSQIKRIRRVHPEAYESTSRISLVSSWIPSLFLGVFAPIEVSDASGMNLMNVLTGKWDDRLLDICGGPSLRSKLGPEPAEGGVTLGNVSAYWQKRWGFSATCAVAPFTGDNPATVVALSAPGDAILSLGTSTTLLVSIPPADTAPARPTTSHLLAHPATPGATIAMLCIKNGALAREHIRDAHANADWTRFNELVESAPPGNNGLFGLYFPLPEIAPAGVHGDFFFSTAADGSVKRIDALPADAAPRAILESQLLLIRSRLEEIMPAGGPPLRRLLLTGGSSANTVIRQLAADVFDIPAYVATRGQQGAGLGGAVLARFAYWSTQMGPGAEFEEMIAGQPDGMKLVASPKPEVVSVYDRIEPLYRACEDEVIKACATAA